MQAKLNGAVIREGKIRTLETQEDVDIQNISLMHRLREDLIVEPESLKNVRESDEPCLKDERFSPIYS